MDIPILGLAGYSGTGKTTLLEKVIPLLKERGLRVAVIKHDVHGLDLDGKGHDSGRFAEAGAACTVASSLKNTSIFLARPLELWEAAAFVKDADIILVEGYKNADIPQIGLAREATGKGFTAAVSRFIALVTDIPQENAKVPVFAFDEYEKIAEFIAARAKA